MSSDREFTNGRSSSRRNDVFGEFAPVIGRFKALYAAAYYLDPERAIVMRRDLDAELSDIERNLRTDSPAPNGSSDDYANDSRANRSTRINDEILAYLTDIGRPVTVDEVREHLEHVRLGEPRDSLITRMSRLAALNKIIRRTRGYYEAPLPDAEDNSSY